jgi:hypothetical protein
LEEGWYQRYYRFLETRDEYFNPDIHEIPSQGRWMIYGVDLPDAVLKKVYSENAPRVILKQPPQTGEEVNPDLAERA